MSFICIYMYIVNLAVCTNDEENFDKFDSSVHVHVCYYTHLKYMYACM